MTAAQTPAPKSMSIAVPITSPTTMSPLEYMAAPWPSPGDVPRSSVQGACHRRAADSRCHPAGVPECGDADWHPEVFTGGEGASRSRTVRTLRNRPGAAAVGTRDGRHRTAVPRVAGSPRGRMQGSSRPRVHPVRPPRTLTARHRTATTADPCPNSPWLAVTPTRASAHLPCAGLPPQLPGQLADLGDGLGRHRLAEGGQTAAGIDRQPPAQRRRARPAAASPPRPRRTAPRSSYHSNSSAVDRS